MDMIERVARALCESERAGRIIRGYQPLDIPWSEFVPDARAAIAAMREINRDMRIAGEREMMARHTNLDCFRDPYVDSTWGKMIDAALGGSTDAEPEQAGDEAVRIAMLVEALQIARFYVDAAIARGGGEGQAHAGCVADLAQIDAALGNTDAA